MAKGGWFSPFKQDMPRLIPIARELLKSSDIMTLQPALDALENMGDAARPAIPELKTLLTAKEGFIRERAGRFLRQLSPADMPPIIE
jgi:hypothetical protein